MRFQRSLRRWLLWSVALVGLIILLSNRWVINSTDDYIYSDWALLPDNDFGLVLGTSNYTRDGRANPYFQGRVQAAAELYRIGKVQHLIVSGANPDSTYNEPRRMWQELVKLGVPAKAITMDFAGFRTLDSVARMQEVFGLTRGTVITQQFHAHRAVFIGRKMNMQVVGFAAPMADNATPWRAALREVFARVKAVLDLFLLRTEPRFLGEPVDIQIQNDAEAA